MKNKLIIILLLSALIAMLTGCKEDTGDKDGLNPTPGTYEGTGKGNNGDIKVKITLTKDRIDQVEILEEEETEGIKETAIEEIPQKIVENQSITVDTVSGATWTSKGIMEAVENALKAAGADVNKFKNNDATNADKRIFMIQRTIEDLNNSLIKEVGYMGEGNNNINQLKVSLPYLSYEKIAPIEVQGKSIGRNGSNTLLHITD